MIERDPVSKRTTVAVDAMGGDSAPSVVLEGVAAACVDDPDLEVLLVGEPTLVEDFAKTHERVTAVPATEVISMGEHPANAVRKKKDSSIVVGCQAVRAGNAQGFFSAGSTGACLAAAIMIMGRIKGVKRPGLGVVIPAYERPCMLMDVGANADCRPEYLVQFAHMAAIYMERMLGVQMPKVGLLNIGEEKTKGSTMAQEAYCLLERDIPGFAGNCEGGPLAQGAFDVVVTDGFTGNVCLKTIEGTSKLLFKYVKDAMTSTMLSKVGAALVRSQLMQLKEKISPDAYGGTPLLGVRGTCIIGHGSSNAAAIKNGILAACREIRGNICAEIEQQMKAMPKDGEES